MAVGVLVDVGVAVVVPVAVGVGVPVDVDVGVGVGVAVGTVMLRRSSMVRGGLDAVMTTVIASNTRCTPRRYLQVLVLSVTVRDASVVVDIMRLLRRSVPSYLQYASTL